LANFRIALVQPLTVPPPGDAENVAAAVTSIAAAAAQGADFVCFPESYPGPWRMPASFDPAAAIAEAAAKHGVYAVFGTLEPQWQRPELYDSFYPRPLAAPLASPSATATPSQQAAE
jgi:predicted amidohydrolase